MTSCVRDATPAVQRRLVIGCISLRIVPLTVASRTAAQGKKLVDELRDTADEAFDVIDTTRDGKISLQEAFAAPALLKEWWQQKR